ncbi:response regulator, partial [bacterium]|nr:response regulator [bacterium]
MATFEEQLRQNYIEKIEAQIEALKTAKQSFQFGDPGAESSIRRIAHMLRGSGATYGFPEISQSAQSVEESSEEALVNEIDHLLEVLSQTSLPEQSKASILIIDDDVSSSELLKVLLTSDDREIYVAYDASEAKNILETHSISLILLDIILPDEDGRNFLMQLRQSPNTASTPIVVITGLVGNQPKLECLALGATHFFTKPFDLKQFAQTVTQELEKEGPIQSNERTDLDAGLPTRSEFCLKYENAFRSDSEQKRVMAFIDIDSFSLIQDKYGNEN